jgi:phosphatidylglycerophosphate synthase
MNLHRTHGKPDWSGVVAAEQNKWQRLAVRTGGGVTPGNICTITGFVIVVAGLYFIVKEYFWFGLLLLGVGRAFDLLDGWLADRTGTKSPLGELLDASFDKLGTALTLVVFALSHVAPGWALLALLLPHAAISVIAAQSFLRKRVQLHPSQIGKFSMAVAWASLAGFVLLKAVQAHGDAQLSLLVHGLVIVSAALGTGALISYGREYARQNG